MVTMPLEPWPEACEALVGRGRPNGRVVAGMNPCPGGFWLDREDWVP